MPDLDPNYLTIIWYFCKNLVEMFVLKKKKKNQQLSKNPENYPSCNEVMYLFQLLLGNRSGHIRLFDVMYLFQLLLGNRSGHIRLFDVFISATPW